MGLLFLLRWFWWRVNAASEIVAMAVSFSLAVYFQLIHDHLFALRIAPSAQLVIGVAVTTVAWLATALLTKPADEATLRSFYRATRPGGRGWEAVRRRAAADGEPLPAGLARLPAGIAAMALGCLAVYAALFATGMALYGRPAAATGLGVVSVAAALAVGALWSRVAEPAHDMEPVA